MASKTGGKKASTKGKAKEAEAKVEETKAPEVAEANSNKKSNNLFLDRVNQKFIFDRGTGKDGKPYMAVSFACPSEDNPKRLGTILVKAGQVLPTTKKTKEGETVPVEGYNNVLLGTKGQHYTVSFNEKAADGKTFLQEKMTAEEIKKSFDDNKAAYKAAQKEAKAAEKGAEKANDGADGPDVV